jgi:hypothetical protein
MTIIDATAIFFDCGKYLNKFYNSYKTGTVQKNQVFRCDDFEGGSLNMKYKTHEGAEVVVQPMMKRNKLCVVPYCMVVQQVGWDR